MSEQESTPQEQTAVKPEADDNLLQLRVTDNNTDVFFRVKRTTPLRRVIDGFCKRTGKDPSSMRFLYEGERISEDDTPESLGMENEDLIEALTQQVGGTC